MIDGRAETEPGCVVELPVLEPTRTRRELVAVERDPVGSVMVGLSRRDPVEDGVSGVQEPGAPRTAQELATGGREEVAADRLDVDVELADRLAGIEQERDPGLSGQRADGAGGIDEAAARRNPGQRDDRDVVGPFERRRPAARDRSDR